VLIFDKKIAMEYRQVHAITQINATLTKQFYLLYRSKCISISL